MKIMNTDGKEIHDFAKKLWPIGRSIRGDGSQLFICRQIVEAHGVNIMVGKSVLGGACFDVSF